MSGALLDFVEARMEVMNGGRNEIAAPVAPPITPNSVRKSIRERHVKPSPCKVTDSLHEGFGWLEEYVDVKLEMMKKRDSWSSSLASLSCMSITDPDDEDVRGHRHRRSLSRRDSLCLELKEATARGHKRMHSRRESLLIGIEEEKPVKPKAIVEAALAA